MNNYIVEVRYSTVVVADNGESAIDKLRDKIANDISKWDFRYNVIAVPPPSEQ